MKRILLLDGDLGLANVIKEVAEEERAVPGVKYQCASMESEANSKKILEHRSTLNDVQIDAFCEFCQSSHKAICIASDKL